MKQRFSGRSNLLAPQVKLEMGRRWSRMLTGSAVLSDGVAGRVVVKMQLPSWRVGS